MMKRRNCRRGVDDAGALILLLLASSLLFTSSCNDNEPLEVEPPGSFAGAWEGTLNGEGLRMELGEAGPGIITGRVIFGWPQPTDTLAIDHGSHPDPDSLYLDVSGPIPPPMGCDRFFSGRRDGTDRVSGSYSDRCGHDPPTTRAWTVTRQPES